MLVSVHLEIVLIFTQDNCKFCTECTLVSKIILDAPMELLGDVGHVESRLVRLEMEFVLVQGSCTVCTKHNIGT